MSIKRAGSTGSSTGSSSWNSRDTNRPDAELYAFETGHLRDKGESAGKAQWQELIDYYFTDGNGIEALEEAVKEAAARLGKAPQKRKVIMVLPDPVIHRHYIDTMSSTTYWGALDGGNWISTGMKTA